MEGFMKIEKKLTLVFLASLIVGLAASCTSTGEYMPLKDGETVIGTVQTTFFVQSSFFFMKSVKDTVNTQAYVRLMETAGQKYSGSIDLRDIVWVTGNSSSDNTKTEIFATGKVVRME
jgi:hypothetical protein